MKASAERIEKNTVLLEVEVDAEQFSRAMDQAYKKLVRNVHVPGFRPGRAPRVILERRIGKQALVDEAVEIVVPEAYFKAVEDTGIEPVSQPELELVQVEEGKPVVFKAKVMVKPEVELGQYTGLEVEDPHEEVTAEDVQRELERLQNRYSRLLTLEEGTVEKGDVAVIDFKGKVDGEEFEGGQATDYSLEIGSGLFIPGFEEQLVGMKVGETRDINVKFPDDYTNGQLAGREAVFTVTVNAIKRKELSPLDDEFAKDVSEFDTLEELRSDIENKLKQAAEERAKRRLRQSLVDTVVDNARVEIPEPMITNRVDEMVQNMEARLAGQGLSLENYYKYTNTTDQEMRERLRPDAERSIKTMLVLDAVARAENITPTEEEINAEIEQMAGAMGQEAAALRRLLEDRGQMESVISGVTRDKAVEFLVEKAIVVPHTETPAAE